MPGQTWLLYGERHWDGAVVATVVFEPEAASRYFTGIGEEEREHFAGVGEEERYELCTGSTRCIERQEEAVRQKGYI